MGKQTGPLGYDHWLLAFLSLFCLLMGAFGARDHNIGQTVLGFTLGAALLIGASVKAVRQR